MRSKGLNVIFKKNQKIWKNIFSKKSCDQISSIAKPKIHIHTPNYSTGTSEHALNYPERIHGVGRGDIQRADRGRALAPPSLGEPKLVEEYSRQRRTLEWSVQKENRVWTQNRVCESDLDGRVGSVGEHVPAPRKSWLDGNQGKFPKKRGSKTQRQYTKVGKPCRSWSEPAVLRQI